jgi:hypothetical protein
MELRVPEVLKRGPALEVTNVAGGRGDRFVECVLSVLGARSRQEPSDEAVTGLARGSGRVGRVLVEGVRGAGRTAPQLLLTQCDDRVGGGVRSH